MTDNDSSSEDEVVMQNLKDVVDPTFFSENLFNKNSETVKKETLKTEITQKPSLRKIKDENEQFENFGLSQSSKQFIAKKLSEALDKMIKVKEGIADKHLVAKQNEKNTSEIGIRLLSKSIRISDIEENTEDIPVQKSVKIKRRRVDNDISDNEKIKLAAVSPDWVLSKHDTKLWTNRRKGKEFKYKQSKNGILEAINNEQIVNHLK